jgi:mono/diheme cytochrome c family protein
LSLLGGMIEPQEEVRMRRLVVVVAGLLLVAAVSTRAADTAAGKAVFDNAKPACKSCHTEARNSLAKAGATNTPEELKAWIRTPKDMMSKRGKQGMMPAFSEEKISKADLDALVAYLATMK